MDCTKSYEVMTVQEKWNMLAMVANLYYNKELTQNQIAERLYTSRSKVSRMLKEARRLGVVEISIREPWERKLEQEQELKERFSIKDIRVVAMRETDREKGLEKLAEAAAYYLDSVVKKNMVVGISWGNTLYHIVRCVSEHNHKNIPITVVPIMGAANVKTPEKDAMDLAKDLASAYGGKYQYIYAPLFVNSKDLRKSLIREQNIKNVLERSRNASLMLTSVGSIVYKTWSNFLSVKTLESLEAKGAVGHIGGHFYNMYGAEIETQLADRMIGVALEDMKRCKEVVCVAYGEGKAEAVLGALRGGFIDTLITDDMCASKIVEKIHEKE